MPLLLGADALEDGGGLDVFGAADGGADGAPEAGPSFHMMPLLSGAEPDGGALLAGAAVPALCGLLQMIVPCGVGLDWAKAVLAAIKAAPVIAT